MKKSLAGPRAFLWSHFSFTLVVLAIYFVVTAVAQPGDWLYSVFFAEDYLFENLQVLVCLAVCYVAFKIASKTPIEWLKVCMIIGGILMFFVAGEEVSWGQRVFDFQLDYFSMHNYQGETNLHNLLPLESDLRPYYLIAFFIGVVLNGIGYKIAEKISVPWAFTNSAVSALLIGILYWALPMQKNIYFYEYTEIWIYGSVLIFTLRLNRKPTRPTVTNK